MIFWQPYLALTASLGVLSVILCEWNTLAVTGIPIKLGGATGLMCGVGLAGLKTISLWHSGGQGA